MNITDVFVRRPVLAAVISLMILIVGVAAIKALPVRQFPRIESATISVVTQYPGASSALIQGFVTAPISQSISTADGIEYLTSASTQGRSSVSARLRLNANSDRAMTEIMARVNEVRYKLPAEAFDPVITKSTGEPSAVMYIGFASTSIPVHEITDFVTRIAQPLASTIPGVASADILGGQSLAMRIWIDPQRMAALGLTSTDLNNALRANNVQIAAGQTKSASTLTSISANTDLKSPADFETLVIKTSSGALVRLSEVATVELGGQSYEQSAAMGGKPAVFLALNATPTGNPITIVREMRELFPELERSAPAGLDVQSTFDTTQFIDASIGEVRKTLVEALVIVVIVIFLFLGSVRAVAMPLVTVPLALVGSAILMLAMGFSLNLLTLLAMVMAIGLVVDDAIVVVENVYRHIESGKDPVAAAVVGAREIVGPVLTMMLTLVAVYAPIGFLGGLTGSLFREFAFALAGAVVISGVVAITLAPMMASYLLSATTLNGGFAKKIEHVFARLSVRYRSLLSRVLSRRPFVYAFGVAVLALIGLMLQSVKRELAPTEDQGSIFVAVKGPQQANIDFTEARTTQLEAAFRSLPEAKSTFILSGTDGPSNGFAGVNLVPWHDRSRTASQLLSVVQEQITAIPGQSNFAFLLPSLPGSSGGFPVQLVLRANRPYDVLFERTEALKAKARESGLFSVVDSDLAMNNPVSTLDIDRDLANSLGVTMSDIAQTVATFLGENYVNRFGFEGRSYDVIPQVQRSSRQDSADLGNFSVRSLSGRLVPLSSVVRSSESVEPNKRTQFNQLNASTLQAIPAPGVSMGEAVEFLTRELGSDSMKDVSVDWLSDSRQYVQEGNQLLLTFAFALVVIFLLLSAQFESMRDALVILIAVPMSVAGALAPLALGFATLNIYTQIGLVTLIGLISRHGILMVDFANARQRDGLSQREAIEQAATVRLRPILMTTAAMIAGLMPLVMASGAGSASRFSIGIVVVCGMAVGTLFTLFVLPAFYLLLGRNHRDAAHSRRALTLATVLRPDAARD